MFFLLRMAFWLTVVLVLLPFFPLGQTHGPDGSSAPPLDTMQALSAASSAVSDASGFCSRQPQACAIGRDIVQVLGERAEIGARLALSYISEQIADQKRRAAERAASHSPGDTLTAHDLSPDWISPVTEPREAEAERGTTEHGKAAGTASPAAAPTVPTPPRKPS